MLGRARGCVGELGPVGGGGGHRSVRRAVVDGACEVSSRRSVRALRGDTPPSLCFLVKGFFSSYCIYRTVIGTRRGIRHTVGALQTEQKETVSVALPSPPASDK